MLKEFKLIEPKIKKHKSGWLVTETLVKDVITIHEIFATTCQLLNVEPKQMLRPAATDALQDAKQVYCYYSKLLTSSYTKNIGDLLGKDHTSAIYGFRTAKNLLSANDARLTAKIELVGKQLKKIMHEKVRN